MKDTNLLPYILPNVFSISNSLSASQFATTVLPSLKPLFAIREPPQSMLTLLDNLTMLQDKTEKNVFRERRPIFRCFSVIELYIFSDVLPLVYNALESEHAIVCTSVLHSASCIVNDIPQVQERALKVVPGLCESIDYAEVQGVLFPRVAVRSLSVIFQIQNSNACLQLVFTKTRILTVKVATLVTFLAMVKTLDQVSCI